MSQDHPRNIYVTQKDYEWLLEYLGLAVEDEKDDKDIPSEKPTNNAQTDVIE